MQGSQTKKQLVKKYKTTYTTFRLWLKPFIEKKILIVEKNQRIFTPKQVEIIIQCLGEPE